MTQNTVSKFLAASLTQKSLARSGKKKGMVITVSRDTGCDGAAIAEQLVKLLNSDTSQKKKNAQWRYVSKEILERSAAELHMHPDKVTRLLNAQEKNLLEEMLLALSSENYPSDLKIKKTIKSVILSVAGEGNVVILGRAAISIIGNADNALHVKLTAPLPWRIEQVQKGEKLTAVKARHYIEQSDHDRQAMKAFYRGSKITYSDYDLVFNVSTLSNIEIARSIKEIIVNRS
jgi:cytidylate kinase